MRDHAYPSAVIPASNPSGGQWLWFRRWTAALSHRLWWKKGAVRHLRQGLILWAAWIRDSSFHLVGQGPSHPF